MPSVTGRSHVPGGGSTRLEGHAVLVAEPGAQALVPRDYPAQSLGERAHVELAAQAHRERHVVDGCARDHLVQEPQEPLLLGDGHLAGAQNGDDPLPLGLLRHPLADLHLQQGAPDIGDVTFVGCSHDLPLFLHRRTLNGRR